MTATSRSTKLAGGAGRGHARSYRGAMSAQKKRAAKRPVLIRASGCRYFFSPASLRSASARSVFSQEKAVAVCFLPAPST